jgi:hypothetical protein
VVTFAEREREREFAQMASFRYCEFLTEPSLIFLGAMRTYKLRVAAGNVLLLVEGSQSSLGGSAAVTPIVSAACAHVECGAVGGPGIGRGNPCIQTKTCRSSTHSTSNPTRPDQL